MNPAIPGTFVQLVVLAAVLVFLVTSLAAVLTTAIISRHGLMYLGSQFTLLFFSLYLSRSWSYPLVFSPVFGSLDGFGHATLAACFVSIAFAGDTTLKYRVWDAALLRDGQVAVPRLLIGVSRLAIYLVTVLVILQFVYGQSITALAALSGAFALVLGLSAQSTLGEMFAGIAIAVSKPFRLGDWVKIGTIEEGQIIDMTWRLVSIRNSSGSTVNITNRLVADQPITNFSHPSRIVRLTEILYFDLQLDPTSVQRILTEALAETPGVLRDPAPSAVFRGMRDGVGEYSLRYFIDDYAERDGIGEHVWKAVINAARQSGTPFAIPRQRLEVSAEPWRQTD